MYKDLLASVRDRYGTSDASLGMAQWMCENTTLARKPFNFSEYEFQRAIADDEHPNLACEKCSQVGLALDLETPLPTPTGWTTMGEVEIGDHLLAPNGYPTMVTYTSPIYEDHPCYKITFDTNESIIADENHKWYVKVNKRNKKILPDHGVVNTKFLFENFNTTKFYIPNTNPLKLPQQDLPLDPWVLGLWLGDGHSYSARFTSTMNDADKYRIRMYDKNYKLDYLNGIEHTILYDNKSIFSLLNQLNLIKNKHIPSQYMRGSFQQRLELIRGLLDTDGSITKNGRISFYNTSTTLISQFEELIASIGLKTRTRWRLNKPSIMKNGHTITPRKSVGEVSFAPSDMTEFFTLPRKRDRQRKVDFSPRFTTNRTILDIEIVESRPVRCITVSSPDHLYLAGKGMIPTHNTEIQIRKFLAYLRRNTAVSGIFTLPNEKMFKRIYNGRMKPIMDADAIFNPPMGISPVRRIDMVQIYDSFGYITGCTEGDATSISADFLFHDELDLSPMNMIGLFQSRLQDSQMKMTQAFSTPTFVDFGINSRYQRSDQREYMLQCEACNHWQIPEFSLKFINVGIDLEDLTHLKSDQINSLNLNDIHVCCENCHRPLDLADGSRREWIARYPTRSLTRGYKVRPFSTARIKLDYIFRQLDNYQTQDYMRGFYNTVLGEPYTATDAQIGREQILAVMNPNASIPNVPKGTPVFLGLDMGTVCHLTLGTDTVDNKFEIFLFEQIPLPFLDERMKQIFSTYSIVQGVVDRYPYTPTSNAMRDESGYLIIPVHYTTGISAPLVLAKDETGAIDYYKINRTYSLDRIRQLINFKSVVFSGYGALKETIINHLRNMVRDEQPEKEAEWKKLNEADHFFHSLGYCNMARRICDHIYSLGTVGLKTNAMVGGIALSSSKTTLTGQVGADRISKLGGVSGLKSLG